MTIAPWRWASSATLGGVGRLDEARSCVKFDGWTRRTARARPSASGPSKSPARVRFVVPTSISFAPGPPDDLRDAHAAADLDQLAARHDDPAASGQPDRERERRGVVVRHQRVLGTGQRDEVVLGDRGTARRAARSSRSSSRSSVTPAPRRGCRDRGAGHGARPRFVWTITPVALMTVLDAATAPEGGRAGRRRSSASASTSRGAGAAASRSALARRRRTSRRRAPARRDRIARRARRASDREHRVDARGSTARRTRVDHRRPRMPSTGGGSAWESNPPRHAERSVTGFEDRGTHRDPSAPAGDGTAIDGWRRLDGAAPYDRPMTDARRPPPIRLTELTDCGGCAAKLGADLLADALAGLGAQAGAATS